MADDDKKYQLSDSLDSVLRAIHNSVIEAQKLTQAQHERQIKHFFEEDGGHPKGMTIQVPDTRPDAKGTTREVEVPILALAPPTSIRMKEVSVDLTLNIQGFDPGARHIAQGETEENSGPIQVEFAKDGDTQVRIVFEGAEAPEALHRIAELLTVKIG